MVVSAGAGSGKTGVLVRRVVEAICGGTVSAGQPADPKDILSITFTKKAAAELAERVVMELRRAGMPEAARRIDEMWVSTIHSVCGRILREHAIEIGVDPGFRVGDEVELGKLRHEAFDNAVNEYLVQRSGRTDLFEQYNFGSVFSAVLSIAEVLQEGGVQIEWRRPQRDIDAVRSEAASLFAAAEAGFTTLIQEIEQGSGKVSKPVLRCQASAAESGLRASSLDCSAPGSSSEMHSLLEGYPQGPLSGAAWHGKDYHAEVRGRVADLADEIAVLRASSLAEELHLLASLFFEQYQALKNARGVLDYEDLQHRAVQLLTSNPEIAQAYYEKFSLVQIDEFQDTNELQRELIKMLGRDKLGTVGDAQQSIYAFRGADIEVYRRHVVEMRCLGAGEYQLKTNYRSHGDILAFANELFGQPEVFGEDFLELEHGRPISSDRSLPFEYPRLDVVLVDTAATWDDSDEADDGKTSADDRRKFVAGEIATRIKALIDAGFAPKEIVMLFAATSHMDTYAEALSHEGIECVVSGGSRFFEHRMVETLLNFSRVLANSRDESALAAGLASEMFELSDDALYLLSKSARVEGVDLYSALGRAESILSGVDLADALHARAVIEECFSHLGTDSLASVLRRGIEASGLELVLLQAGEQGRQDYAVLLRMLQMADEFERGGGAGPAGFVELLSDQVTFGKTEGVSALPTDGNGAVRLMTIHSSKGLEFPVVFLPEIDQYRKRSGSPMASQRTPDTVTIAMNVKGPEKGAHPNPEHTLLLESLERANREEYLRLFYVAVTRAQEALCIAGQIKFEGTDSPMAQTLVSGLFGTGLVEPGECEVVLPEGETVAVHAFDTLPRNDGGGHSGRGTEGEPLERAALRLPSPCVCGLEVTAPSRISYSGFSEYRSCGKKFHAERILRVGELSLKEDRVGSTAFGSAFHALAEIAGRDGQDAAWARIAGIIRYHELPEDSAEALEQALRAWLSSDVATSVMGMDRVRYETPFAFLLERDGLPPISLDGSIDLYAREGSVAAIVDYKTGGARGEERGRGEEELRERYRLQSQCYALAALRDGAESVRVVFVRPQVCDADGVIQRIEFTYSSGDVVLLETELLDLYARMVAGEYEPRESYDEQVCGACPIAGTLCTVGWRRRR